MNEQAASQQIIDQTKKWINEVVVGCNFCPFAANALKLKTVFYKVESSSTSQDWLASFSAEISRLEEDPSIETSFLIFPNSFGVFTHYLDLVDDAEKFLLQNGYEGIYQLASFHPLYLFEGSDENDAANYTNRSPYPMLHLLRESSIDKALEHYKKPEDIPGNNISFARKKGLTYMKMLRDTSFNV